MSGASPTVMAETITSDASGSWGLREDIFIRRAMVLCKIPRSLEKPSHHGEGTAPNNDWSSVVGETVVE